MLLTVERSQSRSVRPAKWVTEKNVFSVKEIKFPFCIFICFSFYFIFHADSVNFRLLYFYFLEEEYCFGNAFKIN